MVWRQLPKLIPAGSIPVSRSKKEKPFTAIPIGNFGKGRPLKKRAGVA